MTIKSGQCVDIIFGGLYKFFLREANAAIDK